MGKQGKNQMPRGADELFGGNDEQGFRSKSISIKS